MSTTLKTPEVGTAPPVHRHLTTALWIVVGVLAAALVALGAWMVVDRYTGPEADAAAVFDDLTSAWSSYDEAAVRSVYAPDAIFIGAGGDSYTGVDSIVTNVPAVKAINAEIERIAPVTVEGDLSSTFVAFTSDTINETWLTVLQTEDGKIVRHWDFQAGMTPPLDNAVTP
jgi:SnoaL-like domain